MNGGEDWDQDAIIKNVLAQEDLDGMTFSGGEPMHQAHRLLPLMRRIATLGPQQYKRAFTFGMYTGYTEKELTAGNYYVEGVSLTPEQKALLWSDIRRHLAFAVMGRYMAGVSALDPLTSSANQKLTLFSNFYRYSDFKEQEVELITYDDTAVTQVTGFMAAGALA
jgi:organic radical activating enzyme